MRVLAGTEWGNPNFLDHKWSWFEHRTPQQNDKPQGRHEIICMKKFF